MILLKICIVSTVQLCICVTVIIMTTIMTPLTKGKIHNFALTRSGRDIQEMSSRGLELILLQYVCSNGRSDGFPYLGPNSHHSVLFLVASYKIQANYQHPRPGRLADHRQCGLLHRSE